MKNDVERKGTKAVRCSAWLGRIGASQRVDNVGESAGNLGAAPRARVSTRTKDMPLRRVLERWRVASRTERLKAAPGLRTAAKLDAIFGSRFFRLRCIELGVTLNRARVVCLKSGYLAA